MLKNHNTTDTSSNSSRVTPKPIKINIEDENSKAVFAEAISLECNDEKVILTFLQVLQTNEDSIGLPVSRVALSWPHFARMTRLFNQSITENKDKVLAKVTSEFKHFPETEGLGGAEWSVRTGLES